MTNRDTVLLETVKTHRARLVAAFVFGQLAERRVANNNLKRLVAGIVLAAVACAGCVGVSFVTDLRANQAAAERQRAGLGPAAGPAFAADTFDRSGRGGWGSAERGGRWSMIGPPTSYAVRDGVGLMDLPDGGQRGGYLASSLQDRTDLTVTVQRVTGPRNGTVVASAVPRRISRTQDYRANVALGDKGEVAVWLSRRADPRNRDDPAEVALSDTVTLLGPGADPATEAPAVTVRVQAVGTNPTLLRAKVWLAAGTEPADWTVTGTDQTSGLQRPGAAGVSALRDGDRSREATLAVLDFVGRVAP